MTQILLERGMSGDCFFCLRLYLELLCAICEAVLQTSSFSNLCAAQH